MPGIYLHIPYCRQKCNYCNFFSLASSKYRDEFADILVRELHLQKDYLGGKEVGTIYFGGGTPSLLEAGEVGRLIAAIDSTFRIRGDAEITLEANPDDLTPEKLIRLREAGINRLSIGIQSFRDEDLHYLNRVHSAIQAEVCIKQAQDAGFENISIDLIFGIPTLDHAAWESNVEKVIASAVPHISAYALTVEERTPLQQLISKGKLAATKDEEQALQFNQAIKLLTAAGYCHYEISNYCKPGRFARHNTAYWKGEKYLGIGPSAHSYDGNTRQWNVSNLGAYVGSVRDNKVPFDMEVLTLTHHFNEYVMTALRTMSGIDLQAVRERFGEEWLGDLLSEASSFIEKGHLVSNGERITLTGEGKLFSDGIAASLFRDE
jgi:oxygen-independent coproporphyrinogen-3 oxidase